MKLTGKDLIARGHEPAPWFGEAIAASERGIAGEALENYIQELSNADTASSKIPLHASPRPYHKNLRAESELELGNVKAVFHNMDMLMRIPTVVEGAVMPDACPTGVGQIPVGGVVVTENAIHPSMHSADICCSVMATNLGKVSPKKVLNIGLRQTHFGPGGRKDPLEILRQDFLRRVKENPFTRAERTLNMAQYHLGTQGDGNHFLFVGLSERTDDTHIVTHHGSRGFGAAVYKEGMRLAEKFRRKISPDTPKVNAWIPYDTPEGQAYWQALELVREWTELNHTSIHNAVLRALGVDGQDRFWNEHNFVFKEGSRFYHAKGATPTAPELTPALKDTRRLIPLNMAQPVLIVEGERTENNMGFAPHGAGRNLSRTAHKRRMAHKTDAEIFAEETAGLDVKFYTGNIDISELPSAYKCADAVQRQMHEFGLGQVRDRILPYGSIMAGDWECDAPWRKKKKRK